jgi:AcrR family transcriptional regulator
MGLRELKARRTRESIADTALRLFEQQGYEPTTMEQIAEAAVVSPSTLYRYFPTKDSTLIEHPAMAAGSLARDLDARPAEEAIDEALGHALDTYLGEIDANADLVLRLRRQIDLVPVARARVWDLWYQERVLVERSIAERTNGSVDDLWVQLTAHTCLTVAQIALDMMRSIVEPDTARSYGAAVLAALQDPRIIVPRLPDPRTIA